MSEFTESVQAKCLAFSDRIIKLNDYLLAQAAQAHDEYNNKRRKKGLSSKVLPLISSAVPVYLQSISNLCNQLLRSGTSIGAINFPQTYPKQMESVGNQVEIKPLQTLNVGVKILSSVNQL